MPCPYTDLFRSHLLAAHSARNCAESIVRSCDRCALWMKHLGEYFHAGRQARPGPREITRSIHREDPALLRRGQVLPAAGKRRTSKLCGALFQGIATRHDQHHLGLHREDLLQTDAERPLARLAQNVAPTGDGNHLRHPMPRDVEWIEPLETHHPGSRTHTSRRSLNRRHPALQIDDKLMRLVGAAGGFAHDDDVAPNVGEGARVERKHARRPRQAHKRRSQVVRRSRADLAEVLSNDEIWLDDVKRLDIHAVKALAAGEEVTHLAINFRRGGGVGQARADQNSFRACLAREVTLVSNADHFPAQTQSEENLCGGRQQRADPHSPQSTTTASVGVARWALVRHWRLPGASQRPANRRRDMATVATRKY